MPLTDLKIRTAGPGKYSDGHGLTLEVRKTGAKLWRYRYRIAGRENTYALGEYVRAPNGESDEEAAERKESGRYALAEARIERDRCRALVKRGTHPAHERQARRAQEMAENANTFEGLATEWLQQKRAHWTERSVSYTERVLKADVFPYLGPLPIRSVSAADVLSVVQRIEARGAVSVALLVRRWISGIYRYAVATLRADGDPAAALKGAIQKPRTKHHRPLTRDQIAELLQCIEDYPARPTAIAVHLLLLAFVRPTELRGARWTEFNLDAAQWRIPAARMKMRGEHVVPLSRQSVRLLRERSVHLTP